MEPIPDKCYPSNFFDPFGDESTYDECCRCGGMFDNDDLIRKFDLKFCDICIEEVT